jgi:hypothetical protein
MNIIVLLTTLNFMTSFSFAGITSGQNQQTPQVQAAKPATGDSDPTPFASVNEKPITKGELLKALKNTDISDRLMRFESIKAFVLENVMKKKAMTDFMDAQNIDLFSDDQFESWVQDRIGDLYIEYFYDKIMTNNVTDDDVKKLYASISQKKLVSSVFRFIVIKPEMLDKVQDALNKNISFEEIAGTYNTESLKLTQGLVPYYIAEGNPFLDTISNSEQLFVMDIGTDNRDKILTIPTAGNIGTDYYVIAQVVQKKVKDFPPLDAFISDLLRKFIATSLSQITKKQSIDSAKYKLYDAKTNQYYSSPIPSLIGNDLKPTFSAPMDQEPNVAK